MNISHLQFFSLANSFDTHCHSQQSHYNLLLSSSIFLGTQGNFTKSSDAFAFEEDSSNDGLSPEQVKSEDSQGSTELAARIKIPEATFPSVSGTTQVK